MSFETRIQKIEDALHKRAARRIPVRTIIEVRAAIEGGEPLDVPDDDVAEAALQRIINEARRHK